MNQRVVSYDIFRGFLLVVMVVFHVLTNLTDLVFNHEYFYFVALGFVLFLGVICGRFLRDKTKKKLMISGKLAAIFLIFNSYRFFAEDFQLLELVKGNSQLFSFEILVPMVAGILLTIVFDRVKIKSEILIFGLVLILALLYHFDLYFYNLNYTIYCLIGYFVGRQYDLDAWPKKKIGLVFSGVLIALLPFVYIRYFGIFDLLILVQVFGMYFLLKILISNNQSLFLIGKHSLVLYVGHIVLLKLISQYLL